jgi:division/cell wall cluster transcriptional repressor MraZ
LNGDHATIYPLCEWELIEQRIEKVKMNPLIQEYISRTSFWGTETEVNSKGRVLLPQALRKNAKLDEAIFILGARDHLEVWNCELYNERFFTGEWNMDKQAEISKIINEQD